MKTYINPEIVMTSITNEDILTLSNGLNGVAGNLEYDRFFHREV